VKRQSSPGVADAQRPKPGELEYPTRLCYYLRVKFVPKALTIAGSDSGAGAGIQADLKTFAALGVYGASVISAVTAQNTVTVKKVLEIVPEMVGAQIDAVLTDIGAHAIKTGMLGNSHIIKMVAAKIRQHKGKNLVVDPVMVATSGRWLLRKGAIDVLRRSLIPLATVVTPNMPEAERLAGIPLQRRSDFQEAAQRIVALGAANVVIKGGHRNGPAIDLFFDGKQFRELRAPRVRSRHTHGTGCTFSAAITAYLAKGETVETAVLLAKNYITEAIRAGFAVGAGHNPVHHFYELWERKR
jgi:hydroxymethylpyrimidine/phosphomethylpyrimidine kinase